MPARCSRAAIFSAAAVQLPTESVVLVSTSSWYRSRKAASPGYGCGVDAPIAIVTGATADTARIITDRNVRLVRCRD